MKKVAVLITCHNRKEKTLKCLNSFKNCLKPNGFLFDIYLVDDGSTDGTSIAVNKQYPEVKIIQGDGNLYWNRGMHLAWEVATCTKEYDYFLWLNDDTYIKMNGINEILEISELRYNNSIISGAVCSNNNNFSYGLLDQFGKPLVPNNYLQFGKFLNGNCVLIPNSIYRIVGKLDPIFPHAIGDYDYGLRAIKKEFSIVTTRIYIANCDPNLNVPICFNRAFSISFRLKKFYSSSTYENPLYFFIYEKRHFGILIAILHLFSSHIRVIFPSFWNKIKYNLNEFI